MEQILTVGYFFDILFVAIAFFTFIKLLSNNVYLNYHRLLPTIVAIITIYGFYIIIIPFMPTQGAVDILNELCDMCATVTMYMMFFYLLLIKKPKVVKPIIVAGTAIMISLCAWDFRFFYLGTTRTVNTDLIAVIAVFLGSLYVVYLTKSKNFFDTADRKMAYRLLLAFFICVVGYTLQAFYAQYHWIRSLAFSIACLIYYWLAATNRLEDSTSIMKGILFDITEYPVGLVNSDFYILETNEMGYKKFPYAENIKFAFEDGSYKKKFVLGEQMVLKNENDKDYFDGENWYRVHWSMVSDTKGPRGYIFSAANITDQYLAVQDAKEETAEKSQFLAYMSHELRSPLHAIMGVSEILIGKPDISSKNRALIQHIKKASDGLLDLVNAILDFSKLEAGKFSFAEKTYNLDEMLEELAYNNIVNLQSKPVDLSINVTSEYPKYLYGDPNRIREIFQNLLSNAVKYTENGFVRAELSFKQEKDDLVHVAFSVQDSGAGMTPSQIEEVFSEYVSLADDKAIEGSGLGLSIVKKLVELMDGHIYAKSDGSTGSTLYGDFYQKVGGDKLLPEHAYNRRTVMQQSHGSFLGTGFRSEWIYPAARVLIADDMKINLEILKQLLEPWKCQVTCVSDGLSAVEAVEKQDFQLILLDQMMAPMSGTEACDQIRRLTDAPVILVTANTEDNARKIILDHGFADYLGKPIHLPQIQAIIEHYMPAEYRQKNLSQTIGNSARRDLQTVLVYKKTLETFVKEMEPLLLHLPSYATDNRDLFKVKVHGIKGVSRQIGRETFADQAEIMEMAAKSEHWVYVDKHLEEFLNSLCDVVEDVTVELTQIAPDFDTNDNPSEELNKSDDNLRTVSDVFKSLQTAFDNFDIGQIELGLDELQEMELDREQTKVYSQLLDAYDDLEYENGSKVLEEYFSKI